MDPDITNPDPDPLTQLNPDPSREVYLFHNSFLKETNKPQGGRAVSKTARGQKIQIFFLLQ
jgi:hypothetical protein